jgi:hypothetical protein
MLATALVPIPFFMKVNVGYAKVSNRTVSSGHNESYDLRLYSFRNSKPVNLEILTQCIGLLHQIPENVAKGCGILN